MRWSIIALQAIGASPVRELAGRAGDVWALEEGGQLHHSTGGAFTPVKTLEFGARGLFVTPGLVYALTETSVWKCSGDCADGGVFARSVISSPLTADAMCGLDSTHVAYLVSGTNGVAQLYELQGGAWVKTHADLGVKDATSCWYETSGVLWVAGTGWVVRIENGAATPEPLSSSGTSYSGGIAGDRVWVVGNHSAQWWDGAQWHPLAVSGGLTVVGGPTPDEVYLLGDNATNQFWNGTDVVPLTTLNALFSITGRVRSILVTGPNEVWIGGAGSSSSIVVRGTR